MAAWLVNRFNRLTIDDKCNHQSAIVMRWLEFVCVCWCLWNFACSLFIVSLLLTHSTSSESILAVITLFRVLLLKNIRFPGHFFPNNNKPMIYYCAYFSAGQVYYIFFSLSTSDKSDKFVTFISVLGFKRN